MKKLPAIPGRPGDISFAVSSIFIILLLTPLFMPGCSPDDAGNIQAVPLTATATRPVNTITGSESLTITTTPVVNRGLQPVFGRDGQIIAAGPPATGENMAGRIFWIKDNNIWQGGAGTPGVPGVSARDLGGKPLTAVAPLALAKSPALSPDGARLAYAYSPEPEGAGADLTIGQDIYLLDLKSGVTSMLVKRSEPQAFLDHPAWSADGRSIYFDERTPRRDPALGTVVTENLYIYRYDLASGQRLRLLSEAREPAPLADGRRLAYVAVRANTNNGMYWTTLKILDLTTGRTTTLIDLDKGFTGVFSPRSSPDGQQLAFAGAGGPDTTFRPQPSEPQMPPPAIPATAPPTATQSYQQANLPWDAPLGLNLTALLPGPAAVRLPGVDLSVATGHIYGIEQAPRRHGIPYDVWLIKPDGSGLKRLSALFEDDPRPAWSGDGKHLAFLAGQGLYQVDVQGQKLVKKSDNGGHEGFDWRP